MPSNKAKGRKSEKIVEEWLRNNDYVVWHPQPARWADKDIFGIFDGVAIWLNGDALFYQVKTQSTQSPNVMLKGIADECKLLFRKCEQLPLIWAFIVDYNKKLIRIYSLEMGFKFEPLEEYEL